LTSFKNILSLFAAKHKSKNSRTSLFPLRTIQHTCPRNVTFGANLHETHRHRFSSLLKEDAALEKASETEAKPEDAEAGIIRLVRSSEL
jgi:hypothetical protein